MNDLRHNMDERLVTALHQIDAMHEVGADPMILASIDTSLKEIREGLFPAPAQQAVNSDLLELANSLEAAYRHQLTCAPAQLRQAHAKLADILFGHIDPIISSVRAAAYLAAQPPAAPVETPFYGAHCSSYPKCTGGCGLGCTYEIVNKPPPHLSAETGEVIAMGGMIERVARAMAAKQYATPWDHLMAHQRGHYLGMARTAIESMREATPGMVSAGEGFNFADVTWENMIDEALKLPDHDETMANLEALKVRR